MKTEVGALQANPRVLDSALCPQAGQTFPHMVVPGSGPVGERGEGGSVKEGPVSGPAPSRRAGRLGFRGTQGWASLCRGHAHQSAGTRRRPGNPDEEGAG